MESLLQIFSKDFDISNMGVAALTGHGLGKKHLKISEGRKSKSRAMFSA